MLNGDTWTYGALTPLHCQLIMSCQPLTCSHLLLANDGRPPYGKRCKIAQFWGQNVNQKFTFLPIKGGAEISAQIKAKTQLNSAKISAPKTVHKAANFKPKIRPKS